MNIKLNVNGEYAIVPEGVQTLTIESAVALPSGAPSLIEIKFKHKNGGTIKQTYKLDNPTAVTIFSILITRIFGNITDFDTANLNQLVGKMINCEVKHNKVQSNQDPTKILTFPQIGKILEAVPSGIVAVDDEEL